MASVILDEPHRQLDQVFNVEIVKHDILPEHNRQSFERPAAGVGNETHGVVLVSAEDSEQAQIDHSVGAFDVLRANVLGKSVSVPGYARIEIVFPNSRRQLNAVVLRAGAEVNHFSKSSLVAHKIEKHAAITVEQVRRGSSAPIRSRGCGMDDHIETVRDEIFAHLLLFQQIQFGRGGRQHLIRGSKLLRQILPDEPRSAGDEYAHYVPQSCTQP